MSSDLSNIKPINKEKLRKHKLLQLAEVAIAVLLILLILSGLYILMKSPKNENNNPNTEALKAEIDNLNKKIDELNNKLAGSASESTPIASAGSANASVAGKININSASEEKLDSLPGIGPAYAGAIIDYRNQNGGFESVDELLNVKGIGAKTLENLRDYVSI